MKMGNYNMTGPLPLPVVAMIAPLQKSFLGVGIHARKDFTEEVCVEDNDLFFLLSRSSSLSSSRSLGLAVSLEVAREGVKVNGFACKAETNVTKDDFFFAGLAKPGVMNNTLGSLVTAANVEKIPGLNTLGVSFSRIDYKAGGLNPSHTRPRATEILFVLDGQLDVGFITTAKKLIAKSIKKGEIFVFPKVVRRHSSGYEAEYGRLVVWWMTLLTVDVGKRFSSAMDAGIYVHIFDDIVSGMKLSMGDLSCGGMRVKIRQGVVGLLHRTLKIQDDSFGRGCGKYILFDRGCGKMMSSS
ncbi:Germin-like protein [Vigna angularis]|uniref:Germin-like protein n=1 Tax=Phaseolus angularis TaxID=3914 RepID=A0A8T0JL51_PHAAN|nr:Germin-like protein [Vigna angularis]